MLSHGISVPVARQYVEAGAFSVDAIIALAEAEIGHEDAARRPEDSPSPNATCAYLLSNHDIDIEDIRTVAMSGRIRSLED